MLVSVPELKAYMTQANLHPSDEADVESTLLAIQEELETYLNRRLEPTQVREVLKTDPQGIVNVRYAPVVKVIGIPQLLEIQYGEMQFTDFQPITLDPMEQDPSMPAGGLLIDLSVSPVGDPLVVPGGIKCGYSHSWYVVEYITQYNDPAVKGMVQDIKRIAAREVADTHLDQLALRQGAQEAPAQTDPRTPGWTEKELKKWDRHRRRVIV